MGTRMQLEMQGRAPCSLQSPLSQPLLTPRPLLLRLLPPAFTPCFLLSSSFLPLLFILLLHPLVLELLDDILQPLGNVLGHPVAVHGGDKGVGCAHLDQLLPSGNAQVVGMEHHPVGIAVLLVAVGEVPHDGVADGTAVNPQLVSPP